MQKFNIVRVNLTLTNEQKEYLGSKISKAGYIRELIDREMKKGVKS